MICATKLSFIKHQIIFTSSKRMDLLCIQETAHFKFLRLCYSFASAGCAKRKQFSLLDCSLQVQGAFAAPDRRRRLKRPFLRQQPLKGVQVGFSK